VRNKKSLLRYRYVGGAHDHTSSEGASWRRLMSYLGRMEEKWNPLRVNRRHPGRVLRTPEAWIGRVRCPLGHQRRRKNGH
jgi:hypothetical protein